jgi:YVTN family beta-propeller protein
MNNSNSIYLLLFYLLIFASCGKEDAAPEGGSEPEGYARGVFVSCEGSFNANNGSVSWYNADSNKIINNLFEKVNGRPAGDVIQSFALAGDYGVIVANNSQKIEVAELETFESVATISGFSYPRHFAYKGEGTGYLSDGSMQGQVYKIDLKEGNVTDTIEVGMGPEQMIISGNYLFVANSGGWGYDNSVSVIDTRSGKVTQTLTVGDIPVAMVADHDNNVWVLCRGKVVYDESWTEIIEETDSKLVRINSQAMTVDTEIVTGQKGDYFNPSWLSISPDGETLYFGEAEGLYAMSIDAPSQPSEPFIDKMFSAAGIHAETGRLFAVEVKGYSSPGLLHIYDGSNHITSMETGIAPGGLVFASGK